MVSSQAVGCGPKGALLWQVTPNLGRNLYALETLE